MSETDPKRFLREEQYERWDHANALIEGCGVKIDMSWTDDQAWEALNKGWLSKKSRRRELEDAVLWAFRVKKALESLAEERERSEARRALLEKHQWCERSNGSFICHSCKAIYLPDFDESNFIDESTPGRLPIIKLGKGKIHKPDCAIDAELKGTGGGK